MARAFYSTLVTQTVAGNLQPLSGIQVSVTLTGTSTSASTVSQAPYQTPTGGAFGGTPASMTGTPSGTQGHPFVTGAQGLVAFYGETGDYTISFHDTQVPARIGDTSVQWAALPGQDNSITGVKLLANTTPGSKLQDATVTGAKLVDSTIADGKISGLDAAKLSGTMAPARVADNTLSGAKLLDNTTAGGKLADKAVIPAKVGIRDYARVYRTAATTLTSSTYVTIPFDTNPQVAGRQNTVGTGMHNPASNPSRLIATRTGLYHVGGNFHIHATSGAFTEAYCHVFLNDSVAIMAEGGIRLSDGSMNVCQINVNTILPLTSGQYVVFKLYYEGIGTIICEPSTAGNNYANCEAWMCYTGPYN